MATTSREYVTKYSPHVDELFKAESKTALITNRDYDFAGGKSVKVFKMATAPMNDYQRTAAVPGDGETATISRYGNINDLSWATEEMLMKKDRSFIFVIDRLDRDETADTVDGAKALSRQLREVVVPEVDTYVYGVMTAGAGTVATAAALTDANIYTSIIAGSEALDDAEVPDTGRVLVVTPAVYNLMKQNDKILMDSDVSQEIRQNGVIRMLDGMAVVKVPASRLPEDFGFMICHPSATTAPIKLEDFNMHDDTPLASGTIVTGRIVYDAFVLENKTKGIYYHPLPATENQEATAGT